MKTNRVTEEQKQTIISLHKAGRLLREISLSVGRSPSTVHDIIAKHRVTQLDAAAFDGLQRVTVPAPSPAPTAKQQPAPMIAPKKQPRKTLSLGAKVLKPTRALVQPPETLPQLTHDEPLELRYLKHLLTKVTELTRNVEMLREQIK